MWVGSGSLVSGEAAGDRLEGPLEEKPGALLHPHQGKKEERTQLQPLGVIESSGGVERVRILVQREGSSGCLQD